jgi:hypothetical protein
MKTKHHGRCVQDARFKESEKQARRGKIPDSLVSINSLPLSTFLPPLSTFPSLPSLLPPHQQSHVSAELAAARTQDFVDELRSMPVAVQTAAANEQHYEVPTPYFLAVLGPKLKYSSCVYPNAKSTLEEAEVAMLELACERAELRDGQDVLELG